MYYRIDLRDTIAGHGTAPSFLVYSLIPGLPPGCMTHAQMLGGDDWRERLGKSAEWYALADVYDALNQNTRATGNWKKGKTPDFPPYPRPGLDENGKKKKAAEKPLTLSDFRGQLGGVPAMPVDGGSLWQVPQ